MLPIKTEEHRNTTVFYVKTICATLAIVAFSFLPLGIKWRRRLVQREMNLKRNREFDAFVSYTYGASIDFAKGFLHRELEVEAAPPFRLLFHTRDFHAATLILVNIIEAVRKSNCAIIEAGKCSCSSLPF